jgi:hypothetical protein
VIVLLVTAVAHYLNGGIRFQSPVQRVTPQVKAHLSVILAVMALVKTGQYYFGRYELNFSSRGVVDGAGYTDVHAQLPALELLIFISVVAALLFIWNIRRRGWVLPVIAVGLWGFISLIVGTIYPAAVQNFKVKPNEFANESKYISRNIAATRDAFNLSKVDVKQVDFSPLGPADKSVVDSNRSTIDNARLWDPDRIGATFQTLQGIATYYQVNDVDIDRYVVGGQTSQVAVSARDLNSSALPSQSWVNEHLVYTHGYGVIASPTNRATSNGDPNYFLSNIPAKQQGISLSNQGAQIYFGENLNDYVITGAKQDEFNYARQGVSDSQTRYTGKDGVKLSNIIRKAAFALKFTDFNLFVSGQVDSNSKILMVRDIRDRVHKLAPFLSFDSDPYPVVVGGRTVWVLDGYTTSDRYPYSQSESGDGGLSGDFNYARNSVKATVDAYDGTVKFYVIDAKDPIIRSYREAFPDLFTDFSKMSPALKAHLRYPEDLFKLQSDVFSNYHVTNPKRFYNGNERWFRSPDPNIAVTFGATGTTSQRGSQRATQITATSQRQAPYYLYIKDPGDTENSFLIMQPFVPVSQNNARTNLSSFMTAKSDPNNYGKVEAFVMPQGGNVNGPVQVANQIQSDQTISAQFTLLSRGGSSVRRGQIQLIPVGTSIVYVQPIYVQQAGNQGYPRLSFVVVFTQGRSPVMASTVNEGIDALFNLTPSTTPPTTTPGGTTPSTTTPGGSTPSTTAPSGNQTVASLLQQAQAKFDDAQTQLTAGNLGAYQQDIKDAQALVAQAQQLLNAGAASSASTTSTVPSAALRGK